jgi:hypothetical protein
MASEFSKLTWLKRTDGHKFTGAELRVLLSIFNHSGSDGRHSHPGIELMIAETGYRRTGISEAASSLKARGWLHETYRGNGKARLSSVFDLVPDAPNPNYRCPEGRAGKCPTCSNGSAVAEVLNQPSGSAQAELLEANSSGPASNGSGIPSNGSAQAVTIRSCIRSLGSDPLGGGSRPSDPDKFRYPPEHNALPTEAPSGLVDIDGGKGMHDRGDLWSPKGMPDDRGDQRSPRECDPAPEPARLRNKAIWPPDDPWAQSPVVACGPVG